MRAGQAPKRYVWRRCHCDVSQEPWLMAQNSSIEWTEATWNPVAGCSILSPGCTNCYAMRMAHRLDAIGQPKYKGLTRKTGGRAKWTGRIRLDETALDIPKKWKRGRTIFVNSMSD